MINHIQAGLAEAKSALERLIADTRQLHNIESAAHLLSNAFKSGDRVFSCGNGGSMCDAMHFAEELSGRFRKDRTPLPAIAIADPSYLTCVANDYGYDQVFARYILGHGSAGGVLVAISTSGNSPSIVNAAKTAQEMGMRVIALTGRTSSTLERNADITICTLGGEFADRAQELHIKVIHIIIELVERQLYPANYQ